ncbi:MAG: putative toxin-antitoxin system toxin component, PIN family [Candidatus Firestonebacteria bacterium]
MNILFDTNVIVAAFISGGSSYDVIEQAIHEHEIYYTTFIINEFRKVIRGKFHYSDSITNEFIIFIEKFFIKGITANVIEKICRDLDDNQVLADGVINKINVIITGDKDLLDLKTYKNIRIISPKNYWDL